MGLFGNLIKGTFNLVVSPIVVATDIVKGDFDNTGKIIDNVIDSVDDGIDDLTNGDII